MKMNRKQLLERRHLRLRKKVSGTPERPRLMIRRSLRHLYVQVIDDTPANGSKTLYSAGTNGKDAANKHFANKEQAALFGKKTGSEILAKGITQIVFDRGGYQYHGIVKALADGLREAGVQF